VKKEKRIRLGAQAMTMAKQKKNEASNTHKAQVREENNNKPNHNGATYLVLVGGSG
jgi:hypothetical protein